MDWVSSFSQVGSLKVTIRSTFSSLLSKLYFSGTGGRVVAQETIKKIKMNDTNEEKAFIALFIFYLLFINGCFMRNFKPIR
jgi:transposase